MTARVLDGRDLAADLRRRVALAANAFKNKTGKAPGLATVLVGDNPASASYVRSKIKAAAEVGIADFSHQLEADTSEVDLYDLIDDLNRNPAVHGILLQLPLPGASEPRRFLSLIDPRKDVDGFHPVNAGLLAVGTPEVIPCTPLACLHLLKQALPDLVGRHALVIGRSNVVGRPMTELLLLQDCTVTVAHHLSRDLPGIARTADIIIVAAGVPDLVRAGWVKPGAVVIDVGISRVGDKIVGDVAYDEVKEVAGVITPVPGGVGPMTIACLLSNTVRLAYRQAEMEEPKELAA